MHTHAARRLIAPVLLLATLLLPACTHDDATDTTEPGGARPVEAIAVLNTHLINNDLAAFARAALPPALHAELSDAWQAGRTRWPLDEFPFASQYPDALATFSADDAHAELMQVFDQQLAGAERDLQQSALLMSAFMAQFIQHQDDAPYSEHERAHYSQLINAAGRWAATAPLADRKRAEQVLDLLIPAARKTGLTTDAAFAEAGMDDALHRIAPVIAAFKQALALYGLELNQLLTQARVTPSRQSDDEAEVELRYPLGAQEISATVPLEQIEGRWYVRDFVRHVREAVGVPAPETGNNDVTQ